MKKTILPLSLSVLIVLADQFSKLFVLQNYSVGDTFELIPRILEFCFVQNFGSVMGIVSNIRWPLVIGTSVAMIACIAFLVSKKCTSKVLCIALGFIIGGGIGNWIDRVFIGYVIDFIRFPVSWFNYSFNIADCAVCIGCGLFVLDLLMDMIRSARHKV